MSRFRKVDVGEIESKHAVDLHVDEAWRHDETVAVEHQVCRVFLRENGTERTVLSETDKACDNATPSRSEPPRSAVEDQ
jgi:hypothetical protein